MDHRNTTICWPSPDHFVIGIQVQTPAGQVHADTEELVPLDTGFRGELLLPDKLYAELNLALWELPTELWATGSTVSGEILVLRASQGFIVIPKLGRRFPALFHTFDGNQRMLIGRGFLHRIRVLLDGPGNQVCLPT